jgi:hypothetical protein
MSRWQTSRDRCDRAQGRWATPRIRRGALERWVAAAASARTADGGASPWFCSWGRRAGPGRGSGCSARVSPLRICASRSPPSYQPGRRRPQDHRGSPSALRRRARHRRPDLRPTAGGRPGVAAGRRRDLWPAAHGRPRTQRRAQGWDVTAYGTAGSDGTLAVRTSACPSSSDATSPSRRPPAAPCETRRARRGRSSPGKHPDPEVRAGRGAEDDGSLRRRADAGGRPQRLHRGGGEPMRRACSVVSGHHRAPVLGHRVDEPAGQVVGE